MKEEETPKIKITDLTPNNIRNFFEGTANSMRSKNMPLHQKEQVIYRATKCNDCLEAGRCRLCGCSTPGLFYAPRKTDSAGKWGPMLDAEQWKEFKNSPEYKITTTITNGSNGNGDVDANILARSDAGRILVRKVEQKAPKDKEEN